MSISVASIIEYVKFDNQHQRLVWVLHHHIYKYYFSDMNSAIATILRLNIYLNFRTAGDDLFIIPTRFKPKPKSRYYNTNKGLVNLFIANETYINHICTETIRIAAAVQAFERNWVSELPLPVIGDMVSVDSYTNGLRQQLEYCEEYKTNQKELGDLAVTHLVCSSNRRSFIRTFELDCELMYNTLCDDVIGVIREFVGEELLESVRRKTISDKYFPSPRKDSLTDMLVTWRLADLKRYSRNMFIAHEFRFAPRTKSLIIERIICHRHRFWDLHMDIVCLTKVFRENRARERQLNRIVAKDRAAARALL